MMLVSVAYLALPKLCLRACVCACVFVFVCVRHKPKANGTVLHSLLNSTARAHANAS